MPRGNILAMSGPLADANLNELGQVAGLEGYKATAIAIKRYETRLRASRSESTLCERVHRQL